MGNREMPYGPGDLDILARAFEAALDCLPTGQRDIEATKTAVMRGIVRAARQGERVVAKLTQSSLLSFQLGERYPSRCADAFGRPLPSPGSSPGLSGVGARLTTAP